MICGMYIVHISCSELVLWVARAKRCKEQGETIESALVEVSPSDCTA